MKETLKTYLPPKVFNWGKQGWYALQAIWELLAIIKGLILHKTRQGDVRVFFWLANPGSLGGTELQLQIISEQTPNCLVLTYGIVEEGKKNLFLQNIKQKKIPHLDLGIRPFATKMGVRCLSWAAAKKPICHFFNPAATIHAKAMKERGARIYYMETGMPERSDWWKILEQTTPVFDHVTSVSKAGALRFMELFKYDGPFSIIPSMVYPLPLRERKVRRGFSLLYCGRFTPIKGVDRLIRAFHRLVQTTPDARLTLVGMGESLLELQQLVQKLNLQKEVQFTGWLQKEELYAHFYQADLLCLPSETEGLPSVILEAMSIGLPTLATQVGGVGEIVEDGVTGILIPPKDETALAEALLRLAADSSLREKLGTQALAKWKSRKNPMISLINAYN